MGEIADMMLEGILCQDCGEYIGDGDGIPQSCGCVSRKTARSIRRVVGRQREAERHNRERHEAAKARKPFTCD